MTKQYQGYFMRWINRLTSEVIVMQLLRFPWGQRHSTDCLAAVYPCLFLGITNVPKEHPGVVPKNRIKSKFWLVQMGTKDKQLRSR